MGGMYVRRKIILWFFVAVVIQNFFLSAPYGRNWAFLWSSNHTSGWQIVLLVILFFGIVWALFLWIFSVLSKDHSWILPVFAIGLGAPRWAQIWWGTSNIGQYVPWAGGYTAGAMVSRSLWLWLGVLDSIQGVGFGMILLQTLTRVHIAFTLLAAQVFGSVATICARGFAPNKIGPGPISPDISGGISTMWEPWFFISLVFNLIICGKSSTPVLIYGPVANPLLQLASSSFSARNNYPSHRWYIPPSTCGRPLATKSNVHSTHCIPLFMSRNNEIRRVSYQSRMRNVPCLTGFGAWWGYHNQIGVFSNSVVVCCRCRAY